MSAGRRGSWRSTPVRFSRAGWRPRATRERRGRVIGVVDWGIGGLGFFKLLRERHPRLPLVYVSDAGETPYGKLRASHLAARLRQMGAFMRREGVTHLVVACNAASTALPALGVHGVAGSLATAA